MRQKRSWRSRRVWREPRRQWHWMWRMELLGVSRRTSCTSVCHLFLSVCPSTSVCLAVHVLWVIYISLDKCMHVGKRMYYWCRLLTIFTNWTCCCAYTYVGLALSSLFVHHFSAVVLGNAYLSLFFMTNQDAKVLKQCNSAYAQAVSQQRKQND